LVYIITDERSTQGYPVLNGTVYIVNEVADFGRNLWTDADSRSWDPHTSGVNVAHVPARSAGQ